MELLKTIGEKIKKIFGPMISCYSGGVPAPGVGPPNKNADKKRNKF